MIREALALASILLAPAILLVLASRLDRSRGDRCFAAFFLRRFAWLIWTVLAVFTVSFFLMRAVPGGPFDEERRLMPEVKRNLEARYGLDKPLHEQFLSAVAGLPAMDFGPCLTLRDWTVREVVAEGLPASLLLGIAALVWALGIGLPAGTLAAVRRGKALDGVLTALASIGMAMPNFVLAGLLMIPLVFTWKILPPAGMRQAVDLILPSLCLGAPFAAQVARLFRTGLVEILSEDWIRTARAKGLAEARILWRHAYPAALSPVATFLGPALAGILTGSLVIEQVFAVPGLGTHFVQAALNRDYTLASGMVVLFTVLVSLLNIAADAAVAYLDPRIGLK